MEDEKIKKGIKEIKKIEMTYEEKRLVLDNLLNHIEGDAKPSFNHGSLYAFFFSSTRRQLIYYVLIPLIIVFSSGGVAFASQDSLPGDFLYPVKTKIIEPVQSVLSFSPEAKTIHESKLVSKRLIEAEILAREGRLDTEKEDKINKLLEKHATSLNKTIDKVDKSKTNQKINKTIENLNEEIDTRIKNIDEIKKNEKTNFRNKDDNNQPAEKDQVKNKDKKDSLDNNKDNKQSDIKNTKEQTQRKNNHLE